MSVKVFEESILYIACFAELVTFPVYWINSILFSGLSSFIQYLGNFCRMDFLKCHNNVAADDTLHQNWNQQRLMMTAQSFSSWMKLLFSARHVSLFGHVPLLFIERYSHIISGGAPSGEPGTFELRLRVHSAILSLWTIFQYLLKFDKDAVLFKINIMYGPGKSQ